MMLPKGATAPELFDGQIVSVKAVLHGLRHGSVSGEGTARGVLLADEMGVGKTVISIVAANAMNFQRVLVVCKHSVRAVWDTHIRRWQSLKHPVYHLDASNIGLYRPDFLARLSCGWVVCNFDICHKWPGLKDSPWDLLIVDEAAKLKSHNARRTTAVFGGVYRKRYVKPIPAKKYLLLTGTPIPNRIEELATLVEILDPDNWSFKKLVSEYYEGDPEVDQQRRVIGSPRNLHVLQARLRQTIMVRALKAEVLPELPPKLHERIVLPLDPMGIVGQEFARKLWARQILLSKTFRWPKDRELKRQLQGLNETLQLEAGANSFKIDPIVDYLLAQREKTVVFAYHVGVVEEYAERLRDAGRGVVVLTGANSKQTEQVVEQFQTDPEIQFFIANIDVGGEGITLHAAALVVFAELKWSPAEMQQAEDRLHRIGQTRPVRIVHFLLDGTLDPIIARALQRKVQVSQKALNPEGAESAEVERRIMLMD
jgi:SWI/SNF-related matrix-associated actin-dependent regulator 1 of chromatin subfamily A